MPDDRYPLKAVRELREQASKVAEEALADAVRVHERAEAHAAQARRALATFRRDERDRLRRERERLRTCRASELLREDAYAARQRAREAVLALELAQARHAVHMASVGVEQARRQLGRKAVEREVVERHADRWRSDRRKADERRREDEFDEIASQKNRQ